MHVIADDHGEVRDDALEDVLKQMDSCQLSREEDSEDEQLTVNREQIQRAVAPISFQEIPLGMILKLTVRTVIRKCC